MIGMNEKDALGAPEDIAIFAGHKAAVQNRAGINGERENQRVFTTATVALRERSQKPGQLRAELDTLQRNRNVAAVIALPAAATLKHVIKDFANAMNVSEEEMLRRYNPVRTQHFNRQVNDGLEKGWFSTDPRVQMTDKTKSWYVPGLDADHGF